MQATTISTHEAMLFQRRFRRSVRLRSSTWRSLSFSLRSSSTVCLSSEDSGSGTTPTLYRRVDRWDVTSASPLTHLATT